MSDDEAFRQALLEASQDYRASLPALLAEMETHWQAGALRELRRALHSMAGAAKTFGLGEVTDAARAAEEWLEPYCEQGIPVPGAEHAAFTRLFEALRRTAAP